MDERLNFRGNGKLLISGEYVVLDGSTALALPTKQGQNLMVKPSEKQGIHWTSLDHNGNTWFDTHLDRLVLGKRNGNSESTDELLIKLFRSAQELNPKFLSETRGFDCISELEFPRDWGLGSSSTLIHNVAAWAKVDPFRLSDETLGGSGYDIAAAGHSQPILYKRVDGRAEIRPVKLAWNFTDELFFVHLNRKQNSREGIAHYRQSTNREIKSSAIAEVSEISEALVNTSDIHEFSKLLDSHDQVISALLKIPPAGVKMFPDYPGIVKYLGAWGGDFVMVSGTVPELNYFRKKGYLTIIPFSEMIL